MYKSTQLKTIDVPELQQFQALYRQDWPKYCQEYYCLKHFIAFVKDEPQHKHFKAYTLPDREAQKLGLYLIVDRYQLLVGCLSQSMAYLEQALQLLDWSKGLLCTSMPTRYVSTVLKVVQEKQLEIDLQLETSLYHLAAKQALEIPVESPPGYQLKSLTVQDAHLINTEWAYSQVGSLYFIQRQIRLCASMGLYDNETQKLIAWCIRTQDGFLGALQVRETHKRCGFGSLIVRAISQSIAELGDDITAEVHPENEASANMFHKLGFRVIEKCYWLNIKPESGIFNWPAGQ